MKRKDGKEYKEAVVKVMWNSTDEQLQDMYYEKFKIKFNAFADIEFNGARAARDAKRRNLQTSPTKRKQSSSALKIEELSNTVSIWNENTPEGLHRKLFHIIGYELAWRGAKEVALACTTS